ncbi:hypothetical protein F4778DRAFT_771826 [Xylariomycetidae sp. FL2044]|nr:hypothetical protein F4778DRAFT_771826 [Xylariomycetidae sp. FL2044]
MTTPLTTKEEIRYTEVIDGILAVADLETVTRKKIRVGLESALGGKDLSDQKVSALDLPAAPLTIISPPPPPPPPFLAPPVAPKTETTPPRPSPKRKANGHDDVGHDLEDNADGDEIKVSVQPPKKKQRKGSAGTEDADAKLAAMLQAQENSRTRATRGGGTTKKKKPTPRKKSDKKVRPEDDSDVEGSEGSGTKRRKAGGGFQKPFNLSYPLADLCGENQLSRPQVVKKLWEHIKGNELQDPTDKRQILCDEKMQAVFKQSKVDMFQMNKLIGNHLYPHVMASVGESVGGAGSDAQFSNRGRRDGNPRARGRGGRGRGGNSNPSGAPRQQRGGRGRGRGGGHVDNTVPDATSRNTLPTPGAQPQVHPQPNIEKAAEGEEDVEAEVCFICASPVIHQSVAPCNHRTCHICALRMRALYKNKECAHCRTLAPFVIFTDDATKRFEDYSNSDVTSTDDNIGIRYTNEDIVGDTVLLLRYNCPDNSCDFAGLGWPDLHRHVRSTHHKKMCDLCTRNKKVFTHEHELFADRELEKHMRDGDDRPGAVDQTGFKGHPQCDFCRQRFYDGDKLYEHCRERHERCFICDRADPRQPHYYNDYNALEKHFRKDHYLCSDRECLEKKFIVFGSEMDLKAHQLSEHGSSLSKDVRRDARVVDMSSFEFREPYQQPRRGAPGRARDSDRGGRAGARGRDPNSEPIPASSAQPLRRDELAFQRQMAIHSSQSVSNRTFGGQLSSAPPASSSQPSQQRSTVPPASGSSSDRNAASAPTAELEGLSLTDPNLTPEDRARLLRHSAVVERASNMLQNDRNKIASFRSHITSYRQGKTSASAFVDALFSLFSDTSSSSLGTLLREIADLFEDKTKGDRLRKAWNDWRAINEDYPTLPGLSGMHGATSSNSGWAAAAASSPAMTVSVPSQRHTTRVLKLKNSTQQSRRSSADQSAVSPIISASSSTNRRPPSAASFPALSSGNNAPARAASAASWTTPSAPPSSARPGKPASREEAFPALPAAPKPTTTIFGYGSGNLRRDPNASRNTGFMWGSAGDASPSGAGNAEEDGEGAGKGKKGNKGRKKVLVQWG